MSHVLELIRNIDPTIRARVVTALTVAVGLILFAVWIVTFPNRIREAASGVSSDSVQSPFSILQTLRGSSALLYQNLNGAIQSAKRELETPQSVTVTPGNTNP